MGGRAIKVEGCMHLTCWVKGLYVCVGVRGLEIQRRLESAKRTTPSRWKSMCEESEVCLGDQKKARDGVGDGGGGERRQLRMGRWSEAGAFC